MKPSQWGQFSPSFLGVLSPDRPVRLARASHSRTAVASVARRSPTGQRPAHCGGVADSPFIDGTPSSMARAGVVATASKTVIAASVGTYFTGVLPPQPERFSDAR